MIRRPAALVTGAGGFVGRHLVRALRENRWKVLTVSRRGPADFTGDLTRMPLRGLSADVVFHLAGFSNPSASLDAAHEAYALNTLATARVVREVRAGRFVLASSCQVYPGGARLDESGRPLPQTPYSASKLCGEALALASGRDVVVLRPFNHTGPGQSSDYVCPNIARQVARAEAGGTRVVTVGNLSSRRDFFDVRDMVRAYLLAAERGRAGEIYNVGTGEPVSVRRIAEMILRGARVPLRIRGARGPRTTLSANPSKFRKATGWLPLIPLEKTLGDLLEYERRR